MSKTLTLAAVAAIAIATFDITPANAAWNNTSSWNGTTFQGTSMQGTSFNGPGTQGVSYNGSSNTALDGHVVDIEFPAAAAAR